MSIVIIGAGPNLGLAIARRFGREGLPVGLVSRDKAKLDGLAEQLAADGVEADSEAADIRDADALARAIGALADRLGAVEVLEYSPLPAREFMKPILETTADDIRGPLEFSVIGAVAATQAVLGPMREAGRGHDPLHHGRRPHHVPGARRGRRLLLGRGRLRAHAAPGPGGGGHPRRPHRDRRPDRARRDHEPDEIADLLWRHHSERGEFQTRLGIE